MERPAQAGLPREETVTYRNTPTSQVFGLDVGRGVRLYDGSEPRPQYPELKDPLEKATGLKRKKGKQLFGKGRERTAVFYFHSQPGPLARTLGPITQTVLNGLEVIHPNGWTRPEIREFLRDLGLLNAPCYGEARVVWNALKKLLQRHYIVWADHRIPNVAFNAFDPSI